MLRRGMLARAGQLLAVVTAVLVLTVGGAWVMGAMLPAEIVVNVETDVAIAPDVLFTRLTTPAAQPAWRRDVVTVSNVGVATWDETDHRGISWAMSFTELTPPQRFVVQARTPDGELVFERAVSLLPAPGGSTVQLQLTAHHPGAFARFVAIAMDGDALEAQAYLEAARHLAPAP